MYRARLMAMATLRWNQARVPVVLRGTILPRSDISLRKRGTSFQSTPFALEALKMHILRRGLRNFPGGRFLGPELDIVKVSPKPAQGRQIVRAFRAVRPAHLVKLAYSSAKGSSSSSATAPGLATFGWPESSRPPS